MEHYCYHCYCKLLPSLTTPASSHHCSLHLYISCRYDVKKKKMNCIFVSVPASCSSRVDDPHLHHHHFILVIVTTTAESRSIVSFQPPDHWWLTRYCKTILTILPTFKASHHRYVVSVFCWKRRRHCSLLSFPATIDITTEASQL